MHFGIAKQSVSAFRIGFATIIANVRCRVAWLFLQKRFYASIYVENIEFTFTRLVKERTHLADYGTLVASFKVRCKPLDEVVNTGVEQV
jgi:hypothetical protein